MPHPDMPFKVELLYLSELDSLSRIMSTHADSLTAARAAWIVADSNLKENVAAGLVAERLTLQWSLWLPLESFLAAWARASLLLFPKKRSSKCRGDYLCKILRIPDDHLLSNRTLRNDWMHFDERLDSAIESHIDVQSQSFERELVCNSPVTVRTLIMEPFSVCFLNGTPQYLEPMFGAARELRERVGDAVDGIGQRNLPSKDS